MDTEESANNTNTAEDQEAQPTPAEAETQCDLGQEIQALEAQLDEMKDKYLRSLAEMDNLKKRLQRERDNIVKYSTESLIKDFLRIFDAIEKSILMAMELHPEDSKFIDGNRMVEKLFLETLKRHNVEPIEAKGMPFDPQYHEAMLHVDREDVLIPGLVVDELEKGFMLHDRVLRPSRVTVSKAKEKTTKEE